MSAVVEMAKAIHMTFATRARRGRLRNWDQLSPADRLDYVTEAEAALNALHLYNLARFQNGKTRCYRCGGTGIEP